MSQEEQERHKAEGLCFICHKAGHFSRNCPERNKVPSTSNKPPGVASFGVNIDFGDVKNQRELLMRSQESRLAANNIHIFSDAEELNDDSDSDNVLDAESDDFGVKSITMSELTDDDTTESTNTGEYNPWIGDPLGLRAEEQLAGICYPGDDQLSPGVFDPTRFCIYQVEGDRHIVVESERDERGDGSSIHIPDGLLRNPSFDVVRWYWIRKAVLAGMTEADAQRSADENLLGRSQMRYAMEDAIVDKLTEYCPFVSERGNDQRFSCEQSDEDMYQIWDFSTRVIANVPYEWLKSSEFNIVGWYTNYLEHLDEVELNSIELLQDEGTHQDVECNKTTPSSNSYYPALERNAAITKDVA